MPRVEIVQKHNTSARRLFIMGTNGKVKNNQDNNLNIIYMIYFKIY
jgi:hypothetical protein